MRVVYASGRVFVLYGAVCDTAGAFWTIVFFVQATRMLTADVPVALERLRFHVRHCNAAPLHMCVSREPTAVPMPRPAPPPMIKKPKIYSEDVANFCLRNLQRFGVKMCDPQATSCTAIFPLPPLCSSPRPPPTTALFLRVRVLSYQEMMRDMWAWQSKNPDGFCCA